MADKRFLSDSEYVILEYIWDQNKPLTSSEIISAMTKRNGWKQATVSTFLSRMVEKNFLSIMRKGRTFIYLPNVTYLEYQALVTTDFLQKSFNGSITHFMSAYTNSVGSSGELSELKEWFDTQFPDEKNQEGCK